MSKKAAAEAPEHDGWPRLLRGQESQKSAFIRKRLFEASWAKQQEKLDNLGSSFDEDVVEGVLKLGHSDDGNQPRLSQKLNTCVLVSPLRTQLDFHKALDRRTLEAHTGRTDILLRLQPTQCPNLQTALKTIIKSSIITHADDEEGSYADFRGQHKALIPLAFDLELLQRFTKLRRISRILISILDVETFDTGILAELISTFQSWSDRIPFTLLLGISTTVELFESRFSRATINLLDAHVVEIGTSHEGEDPLFSMYEILQYGPDTEIFLGPSLVNVLVELAEDQSTTPETITRAVKYAYMAHFFANPLSVSLDIDLNLGADKILCTAIRNTRGFKSHCETLATGDESQRQTARQMLTSDAALATEAKSAIRSGQAFMRSRLRAVRALRHIYHNVLHLGRQTLWESEVQLLDSLPDLRNSEIFKAIVEAVNFREVASLSEMFNSSHDALKELGDHASYVSGDLKSETETEKIILVLRSYVTARSPIRVLGTSLSPNSSEFSPLRHFLAESYSIASRSPVSQIMQPGPRTCLERALLYPADYLGCDCCSSQNGSSVDEGMTSTLEPTSLLLTMLNEAGVLVNAKDLWDAFRESVSSRSSDAVQDDEDDEQDKEATERHSLALFYRALAELRYLGLIKQSKRKPGVECIQKMAWMGF